MTNTILYRQRFPVIGRPNPDFKLKVIGLINSITLLYTVELQWLEHLLNHEYMFETGVVQANECYSWWHKRDTFSIFLNMKVCCVLSLESPCRGDSNKYTEHTIINIKKKITLNYPKYNNICSYGIFPRDSGMNSK